ncbi:hypothetical protein AABB24_008380 [Solanum stoloniferum]|uniref:Disease resistance N-terminal domain-containing protein n=1 Tax=Solanum stoloniferum TaxID=62892 RepID=A0ABD2UTB1_9SOLN
MVDAVVSYAVEKLGTFLIEEVSLRQSLRENVLWLRNELSFMKAFLKDAEKNQEPDNLVQQWVFEITSVANDAVHILEAYSLDAAKDGDHAAGFVDRLKAYACFCQKEAKLHNIGKDIQSLKKRVMDISRKRDTYGITHINNNAREGPSNRPNDPLTPNFDPPQYKLIILNFFNLKRFKIISFIKIQNNNNNIWFASYFK